MKSEAKLQAFQKEINEGDCIKKRKTVKRSDLTELDKAVFIYGLFNSDVKVSVMMRNLYNLFAVRTY